MRSLKTTGKRSLSFLLLTVMLFTVLAAAPFDVSAAGSITLNDHHWDSTANAVVVDPVTITDYTRMSDRASNTLTTGCYAVTSNTTVNDLLTIRDGDTVGIYLGSGATLTCKYGIRVPRNATLNIYGASDGKLEADLYPLDHYTYTAGYYVKHYVYQENAAIGSHDGENAGTINIHGGDLYARTSINSKAACIGGGRNGSPKGVNIWDGKVTCKDDMSSGAGIGGGSGGAASWGDGIRIYGGIVDAHSQSGAAIGSGYKGGNRGSVSIFGGTVKAHSVSGAGIGGGAYSSNPAINISKGRINACSYGSDLDDSGAGIGSGENCNQSGAINITGGTVSAAGEFGAGVGAGARGSGKTINISNAYVCAISTGGGAGVGGGRGEEGKNWGNGGTITIDKSTVLATSYNYKTGQNLIDAIKKQLEGGIKQPFPSPERNYANAAIAAIGGLISLFSREHCGTAIGGGEYGDGGTITIRNNSYVSAVSGIRSAGIGGGYQRGFGSIDILNSEVHVKMDDDYGAAIGTGQESKTNGTINIVGSTVEAKAGSDAAAIGTGDETDCPANNISITNSDITATGGDYAAGIGGGDDVSGGNITVTGSKVTATGGDQGAGIGGGEDGHGGNITITDCTLVNATGGEYAAGIGGGEDGDGGNITISGCTSVIAKSGEDAAAIGGGDDGKSGTIKISDCDYVEATAGDSYGAAIGSGDDANAGTITISGCKKVVATAKKDAAVIGGGEHGSVDTISITDCDEVIAKSDSYGAAIGGGDAGGFNKITIKNCGSVYAESSDYGAAIGTGDGAGTVGTIEIINSKVEAHGGSEAAGIGTGNEAGAAPTILIDYSTVNAYGGDLAAGIGGGDNVGGGNITIQNESNVKAWGGKDAAGIGGGEDGNGGNIKIVSSNVYAEGKHYGAGIGGGEDAGIGSFAALGLSNIEAVAGGSGYGVSVGNGDYDAILSSRPYRGPYTLDSALGVEADGAYYFGDSRFNVIKSKKHTLIYSCRHSFSWRPLNNLQHIKYCDKCGYMTESADHVWGADDVCTVCGASKDSFVLTFVERNDGGEVTRTEDAPQNSRFTLPGSTTAPSGMEFACWLGDNGVTYLPGESVVYGGVDSAYHFTAKYLTVVQTNYVDENGGSVEDVSARLITASDLPLSLDSGTYVVEESMAQTNHTMKLKGSVNLIIALNAKLELGNKTDKIPSVDAIDSKTSLSLFTRAVMQKDDIIGGLVINGSAQFANLYQYGCYLKSDQYTEIAQFGRFVSGSTYLGGRTIIERMEYDGGFAELVNLTLNDSALLDWTNWKDEIRIRLNTSDNGTFKVADGKAFHPYPDKTILYTGTLDQSETVSWISGVWIQPAEYHHYDEPVWEWPEDYDDIEDVTAVLTCTDSDCGAVQRLKPILSISNQENDQKMVTAECVVYGMLYTDVHYYYPKYKLKIETIGHGELSVDKERASYRETVTLTPMPDENNVLKSVTVTDKSGEPVQVNNLTFKMPVGGAVVSGEFAEYKHVAAVEPYIDVEGDYIPGNIEYFIGGDGNRYGMKADGTVDDSRVLSDEELVLSYFTFKLLNNDTYQITKFTGELSNDGTDEPLEFRIPKTYRGKKITTLGDNVSSLIHCSAPVHLILNENITTINNYAFQGASVTKVSGCNGDNAPQTPNLSNIGYRVFKNEYGKNPTLDIALDHLGEITFGRAVFTKLTPTIHLSHMTTFKGYSLEASTVFDFIDPHLCDEPVWSWSEDLSTATAEFACSHPLCDLHEVLNASVSQRGSGDTAFYVATVEYEGKLYMDVKGAEATFVPLVEPTIDENGGYIPGNFAHFVINGRYYDITAEGAVGNEISSVELSYFDFKSLHDGTWQIEYYTGPVNDLTRLEIPKTYRGKKITVLGNDDYEPLFVSDNAVSTELVLNENITRITANAFNRIKITKVTGDTSNLSFLGGMAFTYADNAEPYTLEITLSYPGEIRHGVMVFANDDDVRTVTVRMKHSASFTTPDDLYYEDGGVPDVTFLFYDAHSYGEPVWSWSEDHSAATATFTCTDERCQHQETVDAVIKTETVNKSNYYIAAVEFEGEVYTDRQGVQYVPQVEPYVDENGAYIIGVMEHYRIGDTNCAVNEDGSIGEVLSSVELSYFKFYDGSVVSYTGPTKNLSRIVIPKSVNGRKLTRIGKMYNDEKFFPNGLEDPSRPIELVLNENIEMIYTGTFAGYPITSVTGDTSRLNTLERRAFDNYGGALRTLDINLDYSGSITMSWAVFRNLDVVAHLKHSTTFKKDQYDDKLNMVEHSITYDFTDAHLFGDPEWEWSNDHRKAQLVLICTDERCQHRETYDAVVTVTDALDQTTYTARAELDGEVYTDTVEVPKAQNSIVIADMLHGTITADKEKAYAGETVTLTPQPETGYKLLSVKVADANGRELPLDGLTFTMPSSDVNVNAMFELNDYEIAYEAENGRIIGHYSAKTGEEIALRIAPFGGYELDALTVTDSEGHVTAVTDDRFIMPASDVTVKAVFKKSDLAITYAIEGGGTVTGAQTAQVGDEVLLTITPDEGCALLNLWAENDEWGEPANIIDGVMYMIDGDVTVYAQFVPVTPFKAPYIDADGEYHLGNVAYAEVDGSYFAVENGVVGDPLDKVEVSYFDFALRPDDTWQIRYYTGPTDSLTKIEIPKTFDGRKVTVLGTDDSNRFYDTEKTQFELILNENITEIKPYTFYVLYVTKVSGDTSDLSKIGDYAFSWANSPGGYTLDMTLDYPGTISNGREIFNHMNVTLRLKHATAFNRSALSAKNVSYIFTDDHVCGAPVWTWEHNAAKATFTCTDHRCKQVETIPAGVTRELVDGKSIYTATVTYNGKTYTDTKSPEYFVKHSLSLNGDIGVNFYLDIPEADQGKDIKVVFTWHGNSKEQNSVTVPFSGVPSANGLFKFTCNVCAAEMNDEITANLYFDDELMETDRYSVRAYADVILYDKDWIAAYQAGHSDYDALAMLVKTMLNFGTAAQMHFGYNTDAPANAGVEHPLVTPDTDETAEIVGDIPSKSVDLSAYGVEYYGYSLLLKTETTLRFYFKITDRELYDPSVFRLGNITEVKDYNESYVYIELTGIAARELGDTHTLTVGDTVFGSFSALSYVKDVLTDGSSADTLADAAAALYRYYEAAEVFFG